MSDHKIPPYLVHEIGEISTLTDTVPEFLTQRGDWEALKKKFGNGKGVKVGVADTGVDRAHVEGDLVNITAAQDFTNSRSGWDDRNGHGSHVTCHIGAKRDGSGIEGIASDAELFHAKVLGNSGSGSTQGISRGIDWLRETGCKIINLSLGGGFSAGIESACKRATEDGILVFAALGNSGNQGDGHPGNSDFTIGVAAVDYNLRLANFSSRSNKAIIAGYGVDVLSCTTGGRYARFSGTSMATPDQAGVAAWIVGYMERLGRPVENNRAYFELIQPALIDLGPDGWDRGYGHGFLDVNKFLELNPETDPIDPPPVDPPPVEPPSDCERILTRYRKALKAKTAADSELESALSELN